MVSFLGCPLPFGFSHSCSFKQYFLIFLIELYIYGHNDLFSASNIYRNLLDCGSTNTTMGADMSAGNGNSQRCNASSFLINPSILATSAIIRRRTSFVKPYRRFGVKWASILLGNMAYLHFLQTTTWNSGK